MIFIIIVTAASIQVINDKNNERTENSRTSFLKDQGFIKASFKEATKSFKESMSERKKKIKGLAGRDHPDLFAKFHNDIRTRYGEQGPSYPNNYKVKELLKPQRLQYQGLCSLSPPKIIFYIKNIDSQNHYKKRI